MEAGVGPSIGMYNEAFPAGTNHARLAGCSLANGWTAAFAGQKADYTARREINFLRNHYGCARLCEMCHAVQYVRG
eukprot:14120911-Alexandrium_andersonii.AAC.1